MNPGREWTQRIVSADDAWAVQSSLEAQGWQVATVASLPENSGADLWRRLHACRPPMDDRFEAARVALGVTP